MHVTKCHSQPASSRPSDRQAPQDREGLSESSLNMARVALAVLVVCLAALLTAFREPEISLADNAINGCLYLLGTLQGHKLLYPQDATEIAARRAASNKMLAFTGSIAPSAAEKEYYESCIRTEHVIKGPYGPIPIVIIRPRTQGEATLPIVIHIHGGGMVYGIPEGGLMKTAAHRTKAIMVGIDYRLAPEDPYPAGVLDCWAALKYLSENAADSTLR